MQVKSKQSFVRPTINRRVSAPTKAFSTNERITDRPPESVTWISCRKTNFTKNTQSVQFFRIGMNFQIQEIYRNYLHDIGIDGLMCDLHQPKCP